MTRLTSIPISATAAWIAAVEAADCRCQCTEAVKRHDYRPVGGRCTVAQGEAGGFLHLLADGAVMCKPCAGHRERAATKAAPADPDGRGTLFPL